MWLVTDHQGEHRAAYDGALDVDVVFSPFFNALPIRRTGSVRASRLGHAAGGLRATCPRCRSTAATISYSSSRQLDGIKLHSPVADTTMTRRRRRLHRRLSRLGRADLITPPARPAAASSSRQFSAPTTTVTMSERGKLS